MHVWGRTFFRPTTIFQKPLFLGCMSFSKYDFSKFCLDNLEFCRWQRPNQSEINAFAWKNIQCNPKLFYQVYFKNWTIIIVQELHHMKTCPPKHFLDKFQVGDYQRNKAEFFGPVLFPRLHPCPHYLKLALYISYFRREKSRE